MNNRPRPFEFQKDVILDVEDFDGRALCSLEMGLGKTLISLGILRRQRIESFPAVVVCPASVKHFWEAEAIRMGIRPTVLEGQKVPKGRKLKPPRLTIINYDILRFWVPLLIKQGISTLILDETQYIANRATKRTRACTQLGRKAKHVLALSGTPLVNRPAELWPTLHIIRPDIYKSFWSYAQRYCRPRRTPWGWDYSGASNTDDLHRKLTRTGMVRRLKRDVLRDLPDKMRSVVPVPITDMKEYVMARDNFISWLKQRRADRVVTAQKAEQLTKIGYLLRLCAKLKLKSVVEWCNEFLDDSDEKLVIFAVHRKMIEALNRRVGGGKHVIVDGSVTGRMRKIAVDQFQRDPKTRVFIGNIKAAGVGITLTAASNVAFAELYWRPGDFTQAEDRCHRIGAESTVWAHYLVAHGTIEERLAQIIQEKQQVIRDVLDGDRVVEEDDLNVWDQLVREMNSRQTTLL